MATLQITKVGYDAILDAQSNGYKLSVTTVKFGNGTNYKPTELDEDLHGSILWSGPIANCDVISAEVLDFLCICPESLTTTTVLIGEIGLYLSTGELFALGCYNYPLSKAPNERFKTHALVLSPYLSSTIDLTLTWTMSLPRVNYYGDLPNPERNGDNAYIINHGFTASGFVRPAMVTRYMITDTGPLAWSLVNGNIYYKGPVSVVSKNSFTLINSPITNIPPDIIDFAFVYVYAGTGRTQCRAVSYNATTQTFDTLYEDFSVSVASSVSPESTTACDTSAATSTTSLTVTNLDSTSQVMIWTAARLDDGSGLIYQARWDATLGYPSSPLRGQYWVISKAGILNGVCYQVNDWLVYHGDGVWDRVDNTELPYMLYRGDWDASYGTAPPQKPITYYWENLRQGHYWVISKAGTIAGVYYNAYDWIVWAGTKWLRINNLAGINPADGHGHGFDADKLDGYHAGNALNQIPINNKELCEGLNADMIDGYHYTDLLPTGAILMWTASAPPKGFFMCNGQAVSRTDYKNLFMVIGTSYGDGDGASTFNVPDMTDLFPRGWVQGKGILPNRELGSVEEDSIKKHNHFTVAKVYGNNEVSETLPVAYCSNSGGDTEYSMNSAPNTVATIGVSSDTGGTETRPKSIALPFIIKY